MSAKRISKPSKSAKPTYRGQANISRLRVVRDAEIASTSPAELADLPVDFWSEAELVMPVAKQAISLRVDEDVLAWFRDLGLRYQTRMNAVLRSYMKQAAPRISSGRARRGTGAA